MKTLQDLEELKNKPISLLIFFSSAYEFLMERLADYHSPWYWSKAIGSLIRLPFISLQINTEMPIDYWTVTLSKGIDSPFTWTSITSCSGSVVK